MPEWVAIAVFVAGLLLFAIAFGRFLRDRVQPHYPPPAEVIVHVADGMTFRGLLVAATFHELVLTEAKASQPNGGGDVPVDGRALIPRRVIELVQEVT